MDLYITLKNGNLVHHWGVEFTEISLPNNMFYYWLKGDPNRYVFRLDIIVKIKINLGS